MSQLVREVVAAVAAVREAKKRRLFPTRPSVTFFSIHDVWIWQSALDSKVCPTCDGYENMGEFRGDHLRAKFPYLVILDENTIGGPGDGGDGLAHPNCRCRLVRKLEKDVDVGFRVA